MGTPDVTPPVMTVPDSLVLEADNTNGMRITYAVSVIDDKDGVLIPTCTPAPNTVVGIGDHLVTCSAVDLAGNRVEKQFLVGVKTKEGVKPASIIPAIPVNKLGDIMPKTPVPADKIVPQTQTNSTSTVEPEVEPEIEPTVEQTPTNSTKEILPPLPAQ